MGGAFRVIGAGTRLRYQLVGLDIGGLKVGCLNGRRRPAGHFPEASLAM